MREVRPRTRPGSPGDAVPAAPAAGASKSVFRRWAREARRAGSPEGRAAAASAVVAGVRAFAAYQGAGIVATYLAFGDELDLQELHQDTRKRFAVPRTHVDDRRWLTFHPLAGARLERHRYGQLEPAVDDPRIAPERIELVLVPGLAFDPRGVRLGHGQGFYDAFLATLRPGTVTIGITLEAWIVPALPSEAHDVRVTHLATEHGVREASR
ncbi:MAG: 5-formyltetrahydrofolate cyclo-ligase [Trueperaceae bacterium]